MTSTPLDGYAQHGCGEVAVLIDGEVAAGAAVKTVIETAGAKADATMITT